ncbi:hypothetical protein H6G64_21880 [Calothrix sp. FACHB-156]|nr:hypothetical protein [Calothrix sp. FACHB-156]
MAVVFVVNMRFFAEKGKTNTEVRYLYGLQHFLMASDMLLAIAAEF